MLKTAVALLLLTVTPAMAFDRQFVGTRAPDQASYAKGGNSWFSLTLTKMEGREFSCTLKRATPLAGGQRSQYSCNGEGETYNLDLKWRLSSSGYLREQASGQTREFIERGGTSPASSPAPVGQKAEKACRASCQSCRAGMPEG